MQDIIYKAYTPDSNGNIPYLENEHKVWNILFNRQIELIKNRACTEYLYGIKALQINEFNIPQPKFISNILYDISGWQIEPVSALISFQYFYELLADCKFPAASFIRKIEHLDYLKEPDIFHEIFGHCPLLTNKDFALFSQEVGKFGKTLSDEDRVYLARLYWFTVEFGLIRTNNELKIYGAGILSSKTESLYCLDSTIPIRKDFDLIEILRTSYSYDKLQAIYFIINGFDELFNMINGKLLDAFKEAKQLGLIYHNQQ